MDMFTGKAREGIEEDSLFRRVEEMIDRRRWPGRPVACARTWSAPDMTWT